MSETTLMILEGLRLFVLLELGCVIVICIVSGWMYLTRVPQTTAMGMKVHVIIMMFAYTYLACDRLVWVLGRFGLKEFSPAILGYLVVFGASIYGLWVLYSQQVQKANEERREV